MTKELGSSWGYGPERAVMFHPEILLGGKVFTVRFGRPFFRMQPLKEPWVTPHIMRHTLHLWRAAECRSIRLPNGWA